MLAANNEVECTIITMKTKMNELQTKHGLYEFCTSISFYSNLHIRSLNRIFFLDIVIKFINDKIVTDLYCQPTDSHQYLYYELATLNILQHQQFLAKYFENLLSKI